MILFNVFFILTIYASLNIFPSYTIIDEEISSNQKFSDFVESSKRKVNDVKEQLRVAEIDLDNAKRNSVLLDGALENQTFYYLTQVTAQQLKELDDSYYKEKEGERFDKEEVEERKKKAACKLTFGSKRRCSKYPSIE
jgi:hypothetical protein